MDHLVDYARSGKGQDGQGRASQAQARSTDVKWGISPSSPSAVCCTTIEEQPTASDRPTERTRHATTELADLSACKAAPTEPAQEQQCGRRRMARCDSHPAAKVARIA